MLPIKQFLRISEEYKAETQQFNRVDALLCLLLYAAILVSYYTMGLIFTADSVTLTEGLIGVGTGILSLVLCALVFLFCRLRGQRLSSIGFSGAKAVPSLITGLILAVLAAALFGALGALRGATVRGGLAAVLRLFYYLFEIAFVEELLFRGYIGPRLYGFFKHKLLGIAATGLLFSLMHIPFQMLMAHMSLAAYLSAMWFNLILVFFMHLLFQFLYAKFNSLLAPTLFHAAWDYVQWLIV